MKYAISALALSLFATSMCFANSVPKGIHARYEVLKKAINILDFKAFSEFFSEDFAMVDPKGASTNRADFLAGIKPMFESNTKAMASEKLISATTHEGIVDVKFDFHLKLMGKGGTTTIHEVGVDSWKMVGKKWLLVKTVDTKFDIVVPKVKATKAKTRKID
jgi:hypothetical protein